MNIFKRFYCRGFQGVLKMSIPFLPYKKPKMLKTDEDVIDVLIENNKKNVLLVTGSTVRGLGLTKSLEMAIENAGINVWVYDKTVQNPTTANVEDALEIYKANDCDCIIAFGGGSPLDCAKAVGARVVCPNKPVNKMKGVMKITKKLPLFVAIPTTAGTGSETTIAAVITDSETRHKFVISSFPLIPHYALLNAKLTIGLPQNTTAATGMDALTHAVEAFVGKSTTKSTRKYALSAVKTIFENLPKVYEDGSNLKARENMLIASFEAGLAFTKSYVGYVHSIAHAVGGKYNVPHGLANAIILPYVLKAYGKKIHKKLWKLGVYSGLFDSSISYDEGANLFIEKIEELNKNMGIASGLPHIEADDIAELAATAEKEANPLYPVPVLFDAKMLEKIIHEIKLG